MGIKQMLLDGWSWLNYKPVFNAQGGAPHRRAYPEVYSQWVPAEDARRLAAYKTMVAYDSNQAGALTAIESGKDDDRREYGDAAMLNEAIQAHILGREQHIVVDGAATTTTKPKDGDGGGQEHAQAVQERLREWAEDEQVVLKLQQAERKAVVQGDGVYYLGWDPERQRPRLTVTDPGFYYPEIGEDPGPDYPFRVHLAWDLPADPKRGLKDRVRRITWELGPIGVQHATQWGDDGRPYRGPVVGDDGQYALVPGDTVDGPWIVRTYPWSDRPSRWTCYLTDATWLLEDIKGDTSVYHLPMDRAEFAARSDGEILDRLDLMIDFIPVVHVPNTVPDAEEHWGRPALARVLQLLDELAGNDTDTAHASATTGMPVIAASGLLTRQTDLAVTPGLVLELETGGRLDVLDTAGQLEQLRDTSQTLLDRLHANVRMPAVALGTADQAQMPSGYALALTMSPLDMMVAAGRLARAHKYRLLLKFVQRLFMAGQHPDWTGPVEPAHLEFGAYTPTDLTTLLTDVATAHTAGLISLETALRLITEAGWVIEDIEDEIKRIQARQFAKASELADATGDQQAVRDYLGLKGAPPKQPPAVVLPQQVPQPPQQPGQPPADPAKAPDQGTDK
ncbi:hypothetical protein ABTX81_30555 [Kitasatospora sp. NPDC097605]|uniref:hypothetical protein n=1 Tax=Kitasatospora sp. NPDC097605 TaxID=3157226 RepID=UPI00332B6FC5